MKSIAIILISVFASLSIYAQENNQATKEPMHTLFGKNKDVKVGWFVG
jgi:hypothetical protein